MVNFDNAESFNEPILYQKRFRKKSSKKKTKPPHINETVLSEIYLLSELSGIINTFRPCRREQELQELPP